MNSYLNLIKKFWAFSHTKEINHSIISVYLLLLEEWDNNGQMNFSLSDKNICEKIRIARNSIKVAREKLRELGLIQFQIQKGFSIIYRVIEDYDFDFSVNTQKSQKNSKLELNPTTETQKKEITEEKKEIPIPPKKVKTEPSTPSTLTTTKELPANIPTMEEFLDYAKTIDIYDDSLEFGVRTKYESWIDAGWKNGYGKSIINWQLQLKSSLPFLKGNKSFQKNINIPNIKRPKPTYNE